jgi:hypothetical protein
MGTPPTTPDADPWARPTTADVVPASAKTDADSATRPRWHWSHLDDIGWISPEEAATIDPWGDNTTAAELCAEAEPSTIPDEMSSERPGAAGFDPWGNNTTATELCAEAEPSTTPEEMSSDSLGSVGFDPWADSA